MGSSGKPVDNKLHWTNTGDGGTVGGSAAIIDGL